LGRFDLDGTSVALCVGVRNQFKGFLTVCSIVLVAGLTTTGHERTAEAFPSSTLRVTPVAATANAWLANMLSAALARAAEVIDLSKVAPPVTHVTVTFESSNRPGSTLTIDLPLEGELAEDEAMLLGQFFHCRRTGKVKKPHAGLVRLIAQVGQKYPGHVIEVTSGYRAFKEESKTSPHRAGRALDVRVRGVKSTELRDFLWSTNREVGVGWYPHGNYVHMDVRPGQKDTAWTQKHVNDSNDYHPRWARQARKQKSNS
jgi:uncharacterized protein YcbK (DUF882 family)